MNIGKKTTCGHCGADFSFMLDKHDVEDCFDNLRAEVARLREESKLMEAKLAEIVMAVARKFPGETRAQTALRYVREAEARASEPGEARAALRGGGE